VPCATEPRADVADGTATMMNTPVAANTVPVVIFIRYQPFGKTSILPVYNDEVQTTQLNKSKFIYPELIPEDASSCI
jgi:hypothetical protein